MRWLSLALAIAAGGCTPAIKVFDVPADHPANPAAAESPHAAVITALNPLPPAPAPASNPMVYTCTHHPEIRQTTPRACPLCKMKLEPASAPPADAHPHHHHGGQP